MRSAIPACSTGSSTKATSSAITATPIPISPRSRQAARLELNATERLVEAYTGRGMRLFRAPYFGDAEPTTGDELVPALLAQQSGYLNVGLHVDTEDWQRPGVDAIVDNAVSAGAGAAIRSARGKIVLLHDGGGDRAQTVAALPRIIDDAARARLSASCRPPQLAGLTDAQVMPSDRGQPTCSRCAPTSPSSCCSPGFSVLLSGLFFIAIVLGIVARARPDRRWRCRSRRGRVRRRPIPTRLISVLIPAYQRGAGDRDIGAPRAGQRRCRRSR